MRGVRHGSISPERAPFQDATDRITKALQDPRVAAKVAAVRAEMDLEDEWYEAVTFAWHDATCHLAEDCPARDVHAHMWGTVPYETLFDFLDRLSRR